MNEAEKELFIQILNKRFEANMNRHNDLTWQQVVQKLLESPKQLESLNWMEQTGGEPDVIGVIEEGGFIFMDCSKETPINRRGVCYDEKARTTRKKFPPEASVELLVTEYEVELLSEEDYRKLQTLGEFDLKTSSWIKTPDNIRSLGGALFADRRYNTVFVYHNGADSYYSSRAFRVKKII